jgi:tRNA (guanine37-N1)-methyltransferase
MRIEVVTLFPQLVQAALGHGVAGRALARGLATVATEDPREHAPPPHRPVDDRPYGGGPGMVGLPEPWAAAIDAAAARLPAGALRVHLSPQGERFEQRHAREFAQGPGLVLVASRYEGLDERIVDARIDRELSLGDFVLSGGEFAALAVIDAVLRLLPGALGDERSAAEESFAAGLLDWPHYTRPPVWEGREVPEVLQGGNHAAIRRWRLARAVERTWVRRPDLIVKYGLPAEGSRLLNESLAQREVNSHEQCDQGNRKEPHDAHDPGLQAR